MQLSALTSALGRFVSELQRRKVLRVASGYVVGGWIILQVALALQTAMNLPASFSTVILSLLIIGLPVAIVGSWFLEITPEGIKRTAASGDGALVKPQTPDIILAAMLALVVVVALVQAVMPRESAPAAGTTASKVETPALGDKSIAVLPFASLGDKENEYFADGLTEELLNLLAQIGDLKVISRTSSFAFKGKDTPLPEIAKTLGVRHILEGSVRAQGDDLKVTAQLIDVVSDTHLWSETYERKIDNVFAMQDEIARDIAGALKVEVTLTDLRRDAPTKNLDAYRLFLKARAFYVRRSAGDLSESVELYKRAIALDSKFAEAQAGLATSYVALAQRPGKPSKDLRILARRAADAALALNPDLARAHGAIGTLARQEFDWQTAVESCSKAMMLDPSDAINLASLGNTWFMIGEFEQARRLNDESGRIDPLYSHVNSPFALFDAFARNDDRTAGELAEKFSKAPGDVGGVGYSALAILARERGDVAEAERTYRASMKAFGRSGPLVESVVHALKAKSAFGVAAAALRDEAAKDSTFAPEPTFVIIGDYQRFFDALDAHIERGESARFWVSMALAWHLATADEGANSRFKNLARKIGLVEYWRKHGWPDRCRAKSEDDFECN